MRIFTKKAFRFRVEGNAVTTAALAFADVPDWVQKDPIFALAVQEGAIELIESKADEKLIEKNGTAKPETDSEADDKKAGKAGAADAKSN